MKNKIVGIWICMLLIIAVVSPVAGTINEKVTRKNNIFENQTSIEFAPGELIVKLKKETSFSKSSLAALNEKHQVYALEKVFPNTEGSILDNIYLLHLSIESDILSIVREYASCPDVVYAEPNGITYLCGIPNDANFSNQWHLHNTGQIILGNISGIPDADIDAPEAWDVETGNPDVVITILDSGIDYTHPDLVDHIWNNTDEIFGNGIDDDHNGYIDDVKGWDFCYNDSDPKDVLGHGTMCAGITGAVTDNGIWGAGVAWNCKIMSVQAFNDAGWGYWSNISAGIQYDAAHGADSLSMSFGGYVGESLLRDALNYSYGKGVFLCAAAGNDHIMSKFYPAAYDHVIAVAATDYNDERAVFSNYGEWVHIAAPGDIIYSTMPTYHVPFNDYGARENFDQGSGTSYATPMVAGVAALLLSKDFSLTSDEVEAFLCGYVDPYNSTKYIGTGRLNAQKALAGLEVSDVEIEIKGGLGVKMVITNKGITDVTNVNWQIQVDGGLYWMINKTKDGTIDIPAGKSKTISSGLLLGLGSINISGRVSVIEKMVNGTQLLIFSMVKK